MTEKKSDKKLIIITGVVCLIIAGLFFMLIYTANQSIEQSHNQHVEACEDIGLQYINHEYCTDDEFAYLIAFKCDEDGCSAMKVSTHAAN